MIGKDLGTYHARVEFTNGDGYISKWGTGARYTHGSEHDHPLSAFRIGCEWESEADLLNTMRFMYLHGNYSCDCNRLLSLARSKQQDEPENTPCGNTLRLKRLTAIRPDGSEVILWEGEEE